MLFGRNGMAFRAMMLFGLHGMGFWAMMLFGLNIMAFRAIVLFGLNVMAFRAMLLFGLNVTAFRAMVLSECNSGQRAILVQRLEERYSFSDMGSTTLTLGQRCHCKEEPGKPSRNHKPIEQHKSGVMLIQA